MSCSPAHAGPLGRSPTPFASHRGDYSPSKSLALRRTAHNDASARSRRRVGVARSPAAGTYQRIGAHARARLPTGSAYRSAPVDRGGLQCSDGASDALCTTALAVPVRWCRSDLCHAAGSTASVHHSPLLADSTRNQDPQRYGADGLQDSHRAHRDRRDECV